MPEQPQEPPRPSMRYRMAAAGITLAVVLIILLADAFGWAETPVQLYPLILFLGVFIFGISKDIFTGGR